ncbi:hypothetical protein YC2023_100456 [Brassica napus]
MKLLKTRWIHPNQQLLKERTFSLRARMIPLKVAATSVKLAIPLKVAATSFAPIRISKYRGKSPVEIKNLSSTSSDEDDDIFRYPSLKPKKIPKFSNSSYIQLKSDYNLLQVRVVGKDYNTLIAKYYKHLRVVATANERKEKLFESKQTR